MTVYKEVKRKTGLALNVFYFLLHKKAVEVRNIYVACLMSRVQKCRA